MRELKQFRTAAVSGSDCDSFVGFISEDSASLFPRDYFLYKNFIIRKIANNWVGLCEKHNLSTVTLEDLLDTIDKI